MNKPEPRAAKIILGACVSVLLLVWPFGAQVPPACESITDTFTENFDTDEFKDKGLSSVAAWPSGPITLNRLGANFDILQPAGMGAQIYVCSPGDFDGDGRPDLIGYDIGGGANRLILARNLYEDADGDGEDDDEIIFLIDESEVYDTGFTGDPGPAAVTAGDYNGDGLLDFFFMKDDSDDFVHDNFTAAMYINTGTLQDPQYHPRAASPHTFRFESKFAAAGIYLNWAGNHLETADIDKDGDLDILVISQNKIFLMRNPGPLNFGQDQWDVGELSYYVRTGFADPTRGGTAVGAGDLNGDGLADVLGGTVMDVPYLVHYQNDGTGFFTRHELAIPIPECTGPVALLVQDFNQDGRLDIFGGTDRWNAGNEARMWIYINRGLKPEPEVGIDWEFRCLNSCLPILPDPHDVDLAAALDYDNDGDMDVVLADANHSGDYYLIRNNLADVFALRGEAVSTNIAAGLDPNRFAVTEVKITRLRQGVIGNSNLGLSVELYVTSNGQNWEHYATFSENEIQNLDDLPVHKFVHFGTRLMWKAVLSAAEDSMVEYTGASFETPYIDEVVFEYTYVERREYSRTSVVATITDAENERVKLVISGTFYFPGWQGQLRAYDVTNMSPVSSSYSTLRTITRSNLSDPSGREITEENVSIYWDAGRLLADRAASSRVVYTALKPGGFLARVAFTTGNAPLLAPLLLDVNNDNAGLIDFIRGEGRDWKLGDINHSNPIVGPPEEDSVKMGPGYSDFKDAWKDRPPMMYVGSNDGMVHCFDVRTGEEQWAYIPYNLLPKLKNQWAVDPATGERYYAHDTYIDGSPVVHDVYIDADRDGAKEWITMLLCGQGPGKGSTVGGGLNYYFALDVTDPADPRPLWEFTDTYLGETWSTPLIGKIKKNGLDTWAAFMGSGYSNNPSVANMGRVFYAVTLEDGMAFWSFLARDVDTKNKWPNKVNIPNAMPGAPNGVDLDQDGFLDIVYISDLDGRIWKINVRTDWVRSSSWSETAFYTDANNYPIITKPAVWVNAVTGMPLPRIYFGTGGDDRASPDFTYAFLCLRDAVAAETEWYIGDPDVLDLEPSYQRGTFGPGEKVWADPVVANYMVFFSTLTGNIESVDPCQDLAGEGKLYVRFVEAIGGGQPGQTALKGETGAMEYLALEIKARSAVTLGETERTEGGTRKREVYIHEFDSTIQKLEQPSGSTLRIKSWREIYRIIR